jgi:hypothetical protein
MQMPPQLGNFFFVHGLSPFVGIALSYHKDGAVSIVLLERSPKQIVWFGPLCLEQRPACMV